MIKISTDDVILDKTFRAAAIKCFKESPESDARVREAKRRHRVYNDKTREEVLKCLEKEVSAESLEQMKNRAANISVCRKIVDKLAASYIGGVERTAENESDQKAVDELTKLLELNAKMKKLDRSFELQKNAILAILPYRNVDQDATDGDEVQYILKARVYEPNRYDVILDSYDEDAIRVVILEDCDEYSGSKDIVGIPSTSDGHGGVVYPGQNLNNTDKKNTSTFIWWSTKYHFTTNYDGDIISSADEDGANPIGTMPLVTVSESSDNNFWSENGSDLIDGSIMINLLLTDMLTIANVQGWGQLVITGKNIPKTVQVGPHKAIIIDHQDGDPQPSVDYKSSNAPLESWMSMIEQYTALLLSTNNLSSSDVSGKLDARNPDNGIAMLIEDSQSTIDLEDRQEMYAGKEQRIWEIIRRWQEIYNGSFAPDFAAIPVLQSSEVIVKFNRTKPVITEEQKLKNIQLREMIGLNTKIELLKLDNPGLTDQQAEEKLKKINEEKLQQIHEFAMGQMNGDQNGNQENTDQQNGLQNNDKTNFQTNQEKT